MAENIAMSCHSISKNDSIFAELLLHFLLQNCTREELVYTAGWQEALLKLIMYFRPSFKSLCMCAKKFIRRHINLAKNLTTTTLSDRIKLTEEIITQICLLFNVRIHLVPFES